MFDFRPVGYLTGILVSILGASMILPLATDFLNGDRNWNAFAAAAVISLVCGGALMLSCANSLKRGLNIQQTFLLTTGVWLVLPLFGAVPFVLGAPHVGVTDAVFEAMSGMTTTGSTVFSGLDDLPMGVNLWRGLLQWFGGIGIIVVAMAFLPTLKVGGMQLFRSEAFDTFGKILPRAAEIAASISVIYVAITVACFIGYSWAGMDRFDAIVHSLTTVSTGGFSSRDASLGHYSGSAEYVASLFMVLASLPFVRYVQLIGGSAKPMFRDVQARGYLAFIATVTLILIVWIWFHEMRELHHGIREALFNAISIISGTGYSSVDYQTWGTLPTVLFFLIGLVGGCAGSTSCSIKVFRFQLLFASIGSQIRRIHSPHGVFTPKYGGHPVGEDVISSVMAFLVMFMLSLAVISILLGMLGLDLITSVSGAATALANVGPGLGPVIGPSGNFASLPASAKWILSFAMLAGRLELVSVYVLFTVAFWRR
ncbi:MAG: TrkH family potassium uptake protein [Paracoccaceae bacterium]